MKERGITLNPHYLQGDSAEHFTFYGLGWDQEVEQFKVYLMCHNFTAIPKVREKEAMGGEGEKEVLVGWREGVEGWRDGEMERRRDRDIEYRQPPVDPSLTNRFPMYRIICTSMCVYSNVCRRTFPHRPAAPCRPSRGGCGGGVGTAAHAG